MSKGAASLALSEVILPLRLSEIVGENSDDDFNLPILGIWISHLCTVVSIIDQIRICVTGNLGTSPGGTAAMTLPANWRAIEEKARKEIDTEDLRLLVAQFCQALESTEIVRNVANPGEREELARLLQIGLKAGRIRS